MPGKNQSQSSGRGSGRRGFATMDRNEQRETASKGGRSSQANARGRSGSGYSDIAEDSNYAGPSRRSRSMSSGSASSQSQAPSRRGSSTWQKKGDDFFSENGRAPSRSTSRSTSARSGSASTSASSRTRGRQGFASMDPEQQREIAAMGGRASHGGRGRNYSSSEGSGSARSTRGSSSGGRSSSSSSSSGSRGRSTSSSRRH